MVDDSGFMRLVVSDMINSSQDITVVDTAQNGLEAVDKTKLLQPDVVLLDLTMKDYDGIYAIKNIMHQRPTPIVVLSSLGNSQPQAVFEALDQGACDFVNKPEGIVGSRIRDVEQHLFSKLRHAAKIELTTLRRNGLQANNSAHTFGQTQFEVIAIGASTGGTSAVEYLLTHLPSNLPIPIVIAQHMPEGFIFSFAERLNTLVPFTVKVAGPNEPILPNTAYLLPCDSNLELKRKLGKNIFQLNTNQFREYNSPSVDCLFSSISRVYGKKSIAVLLTGMGRDGALGLLDIHREGGYTIAQDKASSVVFGMPKAAIEVGAAKSTLALTQMPPFIVSLLD